MTNQVQIFPVTYFKALIEDNETVKNILVPKIMEDSKDLEIPEGWLTNKLMTSFMGEKPGKEIFFGQDRTYQSLLETRYATVWIVFLVMLHIRLLLTKSGIIAMWMASFKNRTTTYLHKLEIILLLIFLVFIFYPLIRRDIDQLDFTIRLNKSVAFLGILIVLNMNKSIIQILMKETLLCFLPISLIQLNHHHPHQITPVSQLR